jgi:hypothetical protein
LLFRDIRSQLISPSIQKVLLLSLETHILIALSTTFSSHSPSTTQAVERISVGVADQNDQVFQPANGFPWTSIGGSELISFRLWSLFPVASLSNSAGHSASLNKHFFVKRTPISFGTLQIITSIAG